MLAQVPAVSVCVPVTHQYCIKTAALMKVIFSLDLCYTMFMEIKVSPKIMVLLSGTLDLENFTIANRASGM